VMSLFLEELVAHGEEGDGEAGTEEDDEVEGQLVPVVDREGEVVARSWEAITTASGNGGGEVPDGGAGEPGDGGGEHLLQPGGKISNMFDFHQPNHFINIYISIDGTILLLECIWSSNHISEDLN